MSDNSPWPDEHVVYDFCEAIDGANPVTAAMAGAPTVDRITSDQVAEVAEWCVTYHGGDPYVAGSGDTGSELDLVAILRLKDGRWASVQGWNDYTGWGCRDGSQMSIGATKEQVVRFGLDDEGRTKLGLANPS
jgi:hypothetical protein